MEHRRNIPQLLSVVLMSVLAVVLIAVAYQHDDKQQSVGMPKSPLPKPIAVAAVVLPPPPRIAPKKPQEKTSTVKAGRRPAVSLPPAQTRTATPATAISDKSATEIDDRTLLRLLEFGKGPSIRIAWPTGGDERTRLYLTFTRCFGMRTALLDGQGNLYTKDQTPGDNWRPNLDQFSTFIRRPAGALTTIENREISAIRNRHGLTGGIPVHLFPRRIDAVLLGNLKRIVGDRYETDATISASYRLNGTRVTVDDIRLNGDDAMLGSIPLPNQHCIH